MQPFSSQPTGSTNLRNFARRSRAVACCAVAAQLLAGCTGSGSPSAATRPGDTVKPPAVVQGGDAMRQSQVTKLTATSSRWILEGKYGDALAAVDQILKLDPQNAYAKATRPVLAERTQSDDAGDAVAEAHLQRRSDGEIKFDAVPLHQVLKELSDLYGVPFEIDWKAMEAAGIDKDAFVTLRLNKPTLDRALARVLNAASTPTAQPGHSVDEGQIVISTAEELSKNVITRVYDIRDLAVHVPNVADAPDFNLQGGGGGLFGGGGGGGGGGGQFASRGGSASGSTGPLATGGPIGGKPVPMPPGPRRTAGAANAVEYVGKTREEVVEDVSRLTQETIAPDSWRDAGGSVGAIRELNGQLIVTQTRENHRQMDNLLKQLRVQQAAQPGVNAPPHQPPLPQALEPEQSYDAESYAHLVENAFLKSIDNPLSTFSIDVDTASYSNVRRFLNDGQLPPPDAVRIEELVNYFPYDYPPPSVAAVGDAKAADAAPFSAAVEVVACPWAQGHQLVRIALKGREIKVDQRPPSNLVFLIDVSGSMASENKLALVKQALTLLVKQLTKTDRVALAVYAGSSGLVLPSTAADEGGKRAILDAIGNLEAGGSTNGGEGIQLAYNIATQHLLDGGINRVVLCTDGDFNVGITDDSQLTRLIEEQARTGVFLSVLGFGMGNLKDATMEKLADKGNGNYGYVDNLNEAKKVLVEQMTGTLITIAKDVKIQVEMNPAVVGAYRLIGYENRMLAKEDFNNDRKDAGEIGAGHAVTALYEIVPAGMPIDLPGVDPLKYQKPAASADASKLQAEAARTELELKRVSLQRLQTQFAEGKATNLDVIEAKLAVQLAEIKLKQAGGDAPPPSTDLLTLKLRYKAPEGDKSKLLEFPIKNNVAGFDKASADLKFAAAVASFGMNLRGSAYGGSATLDTIVNWATQGKGRDNTGYRAEFIELVRKAQALRNTPPADPAAGN